jgi:hypothetical protein
MRLFDTATAVVSRGYATGGQYGHPGVATPDALAFVNAKADGTLENFNISLAVDGEFFRRLDAGDEKVTEIWLTVVSTPGERDPGLVSWTVSTQITPPPTWAPWNRPTRAGRVP